MNARSRYDSVSTCPCGKRCFLSRRDARKFARSMYPYDHLAAYRCPILGAWHIGHLPNGALHGEVDRADITGPHHYYQRQHREAS